MKKRAVKICREILADVKELDISSYAASTAFFLFLSVVPMLIMICTLIPFTPLTEKNLLEALADLVPEVMMPLVKNLVGEVYEKSAGVLSVAVLGTLWSAGKGVQAFMKGLNVICGVKERRNFLVLRLVASSYTVVMLAVMLLSLLVMVFGDQLMSILLLRMPQLKHLADFLMQFRFLAIWALLAVVFAAMYAFVPGRKRNFREQIPGAAFTAVTWSVFSWGFSLYADRSVSYRVYGSLALIVIAMIWLYFCMYLLLFGAYVNSRMSDADCN